MHEPAVAVSCRTPAGCTIVVRSGLSKSGHQRKYVVREWLRCVSQWYSRSRHALWWRAQHHNQPLHPPTSAKQSARSTSTRRPSHLPGSRHHERLWTCTYAVCWFTMQLQYNLRTLGYGRRTRCCRRGWKGSPCDDHENDAKEMCPSRTGASGADMHTVRIPGDV
jgi:hypothetical protein